MLCICLLFYIAGLCASVECGFCAGDLLLWGCVGYYDVQGVILFSLLFIYLVVITLIV